MSQEYQMEKKSNRKLFIVLALPRPQYQSTQTVILAMTLINSMTSGNQAQPSLLYAAKENYQPLYTDFSNVKHCVKKSSKTPACKLEELLG